MDSEQYEEAVRDYEKIFKLDKTGGWCKIGLTLMSVTFVIETAVLICL